MVLLDLFTNKNIYLVNNVEDIVFSLGVFLQFKSGLNAQVTFVAQCK